MTPDVALALRGLLTPDPMEARRLLRLVPEAVPAALAALWSAEREPAA